MICGDFKRKRSAYLHRVHFMSWSKWGCHRAASKCGVNAPQNWPSPIKQSLGFPGSHRANTPYLGQALESRPTVWVGWIQGLCKITPGPGCKQATCTHQTQTRPRSRSNRSLCSILSTSGPRSRSGSTSGWKHFDYIFMDDALFHEQNI